MRVLNIVNSLDCGGIQQMMLQCLPQLQRAGITIDFAVCRDGGALEEPFKQLGCNIVRCKKTPSLSRATRDFSSILAKSSYDLVHSHYGFTSGAYAVACHRAGVPIAVSIHNVERTVLTKWCKVPVLKHVRKALLQRHRGLMDKHVNMYVGHSAANLDHFQPRWKNAPDRYRVIMNGIQFPERSLSKAKARESLGLAADEKVLLHVGRFGPAKNHEGLLEIAKRVCQQHDKVRLVFLGDGSSRPRIAEQADKMGIGQHMHFAGEQLDIWTYYAAADCFVFPSWFEGFGNVLVEAQAAGVPVVASDIPPHREAVSPEQHRFLFTLPNYDQAADMVCEQLAAAKSAENPWNAESQKYVSRRFSIERYTDDISQLYNDLGGVSAESVRAVA